ncbi:hypothetical protein IWX91DRAFT_181693 [Phyllosticta citricarpa]
MRSPLLDSLAVSFRLATRCLPTCLSTPQQPTKLASLHPISQRPTYAVVVVAWLSPRSPPSILSFRFLPLSLRLGQPVSKNRGSRHAHSYMVESRQAGRQAAWVRQTCPALLCSSSLP